MNNTRRTTKLVAAVTLCLGLLAGTVAAAPTAGAATPENTSYIRSLYSDLLDRVNTTSDDAGVAFWADRLEQQDRLLTVRQLQKAGSEYYGQVVDINYALFLNRTAEPAGRAFYVDNWQNRRFTLERVVVALGESSEYFRRQGSTNESFVNAIYFDVLGREPDAAGRAFALDFVARRGRGQYVALIVRSPEKRGQVVRDAFGTFLGRSPTSAERDQFVSALTPDGLRREDFDAQLVSSDEYYNRNSAF